MSLLYKELFKKKSKFYYLRTYFVQNQTSQEFYMS